MKKMYLVIAILLLSIVTVMIANEEKINTIKEKNEKSNELVEEDEFADVNILEYNYFFNKSPKSGEADFGQYFNGASGCAVFYDPEFEKFDFHNKEMAEESFWINSNTKTSPKELSVIISNIIEGDNSVGGEYKSLFSNFKTLYSDSIYSIYGKFGVGKEGDSWLAGYFNMYNDKTYYAINLENNSNGEDKLKNIALNMVRKFYMH